MPSFRVKKQVYEWIRTGRKTAELRKGKLRKGDDIAFLNHSGCFLKGRILRKREGKLEELLNQASYRNIVPIAKTLEEARAFIEKIYLSTEGSFTLYDFQLSLE